MHQPFIFAHLHTFSNIGQVVVIQQRSDDGHPEIVLHMNPPSKDLDICTMTLGFQPEEGDESGGWNRCETTFARMADASRVYALVIQTPMFTHFTGTPKDEPTEKH